MLETVPDEPRSAVALPDWRDLDSPAGSPQLASAAKQIAEGHASLDDFAGGVIAIDDVQWKKLAGFALRCTYARFAIGLRCTYRETSLMRYLVGMSAGVKQGEWGSRNGICVLTDSATERTLQDLETRGLVRRGVATDFGLFQCWHLTEQGCQHLAIGEDAVRRACGDGGAT